MAEQNAFTASIRKYGSVFSMELNTKMMDLATAVHLSENKDFSNIKVEKGLKYGSDERQRLDVFYPVDATPESKLPVVFFFHGGSMAFGDAEITPMFFSNIGNYFASNACICIISTYRLLPTARYPSGGEDASLALNWTHSNAAIYGGSPTNITAIGQSTGGSCIAIALWGSFLSPEIRSSVRSYVFLSPHLSYDITKEPAKTFMCAYHDTQDAEVIKRENPSGLFREIGREEVEEWGKMVFMLAEYDSEEIVQGTMGVVAAHREKMGKCAVFETIGDENHVSYVYGLGTKGNKVGGRLLEIVRR